MTATAAIPFAFEDHLIRVIKPNGEPWFVAPDVCRALDIKNGRDAVSRLDEDERGVASTDTPGGVQEVTIVSEAGVFRLIFTSRKPEAERFKRWLAHEVLPALRRNGSYSLGKAADADIRYEFPSADRALAEHIAKIATLRECRLIHGSRAAARLWLRLGMPQVSESVVYEADEGRACLVHLLDAEADATSHITLRQLIEAGLDHDTNEVEHDLRARGIVVLDDASGFVVANNHSFLHGIFAGTRWEGAKWAYALRKLPGATPYKRMWYLAEQHRGTLVPAVLLEPAAAAAAGNVVALRS